ncbi:lactonase family protein [Halalkalibacter akibai]|uniref:6-phosphogluconolactonase n=1 Tax=Halalkalibacter akibai (strain ATCC 43226 / DSM 21942 / CIP 109018 / JCM 9157 / 1139) TaxID=1236973 RepID=W4QQP2_HALA3|nr:lactonase family protein [Halalkalibacter akibai]GAE34252.1 6-phosphogluconolactonase [Halalkalibacter akibai JCM 9157]
MAKVTAYIGTYTNGDSKGIYQLTLETKTGDLSEPFVAAELDNPTFLTITTDNKFLYSVIKVGDEGGIGAYSIQENGQLLKLNHEVTAGSPPCHVSLDKNNEYAYSANYHLGTGSSYKVTDDGAISPALSVVEHKGNGPHERQEKPHAHFAGLTPDEKFLCVVDLGTDKMGVYDVDSGKLSLHSEVSFKAGTGPRHIQFHPNGKFAYVNGELSSEVIVLSYDSETNFFAELQTITSLPADFEGESIGGAIKVSPCGQFVYASNRGDDSIAVFGVDQDTGILSLIQHISTGGEFPRDFTIDPTGTYLLAANQNTSNIVPFLIDQKTGKLTKTNIEVTVPNPVCIAFLQI